LGDASEKCRIDDAAERQGSRDDDQTTQARPVSATPTGSNGASATVKTRRSKGPKWTPIRGQFWTPIDNFYWKALAGRSDELIETTIAAA
jgi:hypothetical protein